MVFGSPEATGEVIGAFVPPLTGLVVTGKFGPGYQPAYEVKRAFVNADIDVAFPVGNYPIRSYGGYTFSDPLEEYVPFNEMQREAFRCIAEHPYSVLCPGRNDISTPAPGYIGYSSVYETCWSIHHRKPLVTTHPITDFSPYVPPELAQIIQLNESLFVLCDPCSLSARGLRQLVKSLPEKVDYRLDDEQDRRILRAYRDLLDIELHRWISWAQYTERDFLSGKRPNWINERELSLYTDPRDYLPPEEMLSDPDAKMYRYCLPFTRPGLLYEERPAVKM